MGTKPRRRRTKPHAAQTPEGSRMEAILDAEAIKPPELSDLGKSFMASEVLSRTHGGFPAVAHSLEYDVKKGQVVARPISAKEFFKEAVPTQKPLPNWKLHLVIFLVALVIGSLIGFSLATRAHGAASEAPRIGRLTLPAPWWEIVKQAAQENDLDPCWILAVMAIESRFHRLAINVKYKCYGLMQLQQDVCRIMGVTDPFDAEQNIRAGAKILARLQFKKNGGRRSKLAILKIYNPTDDGSYSREVMKAWRQAKGQMDG